MDNELDKIFKYYNFGTYSEAKAKAKINRLIATQTAAARLDGHRTTSIVLQYVIDADSGFEGDSKAAARHWEKQTDELIAALNTPQNGAEGEG